MKNKLVRLGFEIRKVFAFTLTEVLLAVSIVGVIAALVLPMIVSNYQTKALEQARLRNTNTIKNTVNGMLVSENVDSYLKTGLYTTEENPTTFENTTGSVLNKYFQVSRYCGDSNGDCFANKYYIYQNGDKEEYTPEYKGACASLKNGSSICLYPKTPLSTNGDDLLVTLDINGKKGPNVKDRDLLVYSMYLPLKGNLDTTVGEVSWRHEIVDINTCDPSNPTAECCSDDSFFLTNQAQCCAITSVKNSRTECQPIPCDSSHFSVNCCIGNEGYRNGRWDECCSNSQGFNYLNSTYSNWCCSRKAYPGCDCSGPSAPLNCCARSEYFENNKTQCCNAATYFNANRAACCAHNPSLTACQPPPPSHIKTIKVRVSYEGAASAPPGKSCTGASSNCGFYRFRATISGDSGSGVTAKVSYCDAQTNSGIGCQGSRIGKPLDATFVVGYTRVNSNVGGSPSIDFVQLYGKSDTYSGASQCSSDCSFTVKYNTQTGKFER